MIQAPEDNFIAPDPDEPIPQPPPGGGATDKGLGGVLTDAPDDVPPIEPDDVPDAD